jgi:hypothetical protein
MVKLLGKALGKQQKQKAQGAQETVAPVAEQPRDRILVLVPGEGGFAFRLLAFPSIEHAASYGFEHFPQRVHQLFSFRPHHTRPRDLAPGVPGQIEAVVMVRDEDRHGTVHLYSFVDMETAHAFVRAEGMRGLNLRLVLVFWSEPVALYKDVAPELERVSPELTGPPPPVLTQWQQQQKNPLFDSIKGEEEGDQPFADEISDPRATAFDPPFPPNTRHTPPASANFVPAIPTQPPAPAPAPQAFTPPPPEPAPQAFTPPPPEPAPQAFTPPPLEPAPQAFSPPPPEPAPQAFAPPPPPEPAPQAFTPPPPPPAAPPPVDPAPVYTNGASTSFTTQKKEPRRWNAAEDFPATPPTPPQAQPRPEGEVKGGIISRIRAWPGWDGFGPVIAGAALLRWETYDEARKDPYAGGRAALLVGSTVGAAALSAFFDGPLAFFFAGFFMAIGWAVYALCIQVIGTQFFGGNMERGETRLFLHRIGLAFAPGPLVILGIIPIYGPMFTLGALLWVGVTSIKATEIGLEMDRQSAAFTAIISWLALFAIAVVIPALAT